MPTREIRLAALLLFAALSLSACTAFRPPAAPGPETPPPWFARAGMGGFLTEVGDHGQPVVTGAVGHRLPGTPWFAEIQATHPKAELAVDDGGRRQDCEGWLFLPTLNLGGEFDVFGSPDLRLRGHVGAGYFRSEGLHGDDSGLATTAGVSVQRRMWKTLWLGLGLAHYGMWTDLDGTDREYRHSGLIDLSLTLDF